MRITSSAEYAARLMVSLSRSFGTGAVTAETLSESENVPLDFVNQLFLRLRRAGLVVSQRGSAGGYALARPPVEITLGQVIRAVEGNVFETVCDKYERGEKDCHHQGRCGLSPVWEGLGRLIEDYLDGVTIQGLVETTGCRKSASWIGKI